ncbi:MAG: sensor histidine kinase [Myxococcota bacterium]
MLLIIIASGVSESGDRRAIIGWLAVTNLALLFLLGTLFQPLQVMISWPLYFGFQLFSVAMNNAVASERHVREQLAGVNAELLATRKLLQESARNEERLRISRELHDVAGHRLTALKLNLRAELTQQREDQERIALCHDLSDELLGDIRSVVHQLRVTDEIDVPGALTLLKNQHPGVEIHLDVAPGLRIDGVEVAEAIVRSTQEAITNALKHGRAKQVWITLVQDTQEISLSVRDDGEGGEPNSGGVGLEGMGERARALGGRLQVEPSQASGWTLRLFFPTEAAL